MKDLSCSLSGLVDATFYLTPSTSVVKDWTGKSGKLPAKAYLPDGEANLINEGFLPGRGSFIALRLG